MFVRELFELTRTKKGLIFVFQWNEISSPSKRKRYHLGKKKPIETELTLGISCIARVTKMTSLEPVEKNQISSCDFRYVTLS